MKYALVFLVGGLVGIAIMTVVTLQNNQICFTNGTCKTFYTAAEMKAWLYDNTR